MKHSAVIKRDKYIQVLRGFAITAVVLIHSTSSEWQGVFLRPFLNFAVPLFLFLSGMLTPPRKCSNISQFYHRRIGKILIPYVIWSVFYSVALGSTNPLAILRSLCTGTAAEQMYYLLVYAQLVLLTPLLYRIFDKKFGWLLWLITPFCLILREVMAVYGGLPGYIVQVFCGSWIIYYLIGMKWKTISKYIFNFSNAVVILLITLLMQIMSGLMWKNLDITELVTTQLKLSSMFTSLACIIAMMQVPDVVRTLLSSQKFLVLIGDCSYGVYLCHVAVLKVILKVLHILGMNNQSVLCILVAWITTLIGSVLVVYMCQRALPRQVQTYIGFE